MNRIYTVYKGCKDGKLVYIGTTIQVPKERFRWHKYNRKNLDFRILYQYDNAQEMLDKEYELIKKYKPAMNKITKRKQNLNVKLNDEELNKRKDNPEWCQRCLRRRVNKGYKYCLRCSGFKK